MHEHDHDLIMAFAEGALGAEAAATARAEIAACEHCREEHRLQVVALDAIAAAPQVALNEFESARIRRNIRRELGIGEPAVQPARRWRFVPAAVLGGAAAILLAVLVAGGALQTLGGDDADTIAVADFAGTTTTAATAVEDAGAEPAAGSDGFERDAAASDLPPAAEAAPAPTTTAAPMLGLAEAVPSVSSADEIAQLRELVVGAAGDLDSVRSLALSRFSAADDASTGSDELACSAATAEGLGAVEYFNVAVGEIDESEVVVVAYVADPIEGTVVIAHDAVTCANVTQAP